MGVTIFFFQQTIGNWQKVWYVTIGILFAETTFYLIFASGEEQAWNTKYVSEDVPKKGEKFKK